LRIEQIGPAQQEPCAAHAEERVLLSRKVEMRHLLVAADVQSAYDQRPPVQGIYHLTVDRELLVLARAVATLEEQELGPHQAYAFAALRDREGRLVGPVDIGSDG